MKGKRTRYLRSKGTDFQDALRAERTDEEVQEYSLGRANCNIPETLLLAVRPDFVEDVVLGGQVRGEEILSPSENALEFWGSHDDDGFLGVCWCFRGGVVLTSGVCAGGFIGIRSNSCPQWDRYRVIMASRRASYSGSRIYRSINPPGLAFSSVSVLDSR